MFSEVFKDKTIGLVITAAGVKTVEINEQYDKCGQIQAIWWTGFCWSFKTLGHRTTFESTANKKIREKWKFAKTKCQEYCSIFKKRNKDSNGKVTVLLPFLENTAVFLTFYLCKFSLFSYFLVCCTFECRSVIRGQAGEEKAYTLLLLGQENINPLWAFADAWQAFLFLLNLDSKNRLCSPNFLPPRSFFFSFKNTNAFVRKSIACRFEMKTFATSMLCPIAEKFQGNKWKNFIDWCRLSQIGPPLSCCKILCTHLLHSDSPVPFGGSSAAISPPGNSNPSGASQVSNSIPATSQVKDVYM